MRIDVHWHHLPRPFVDAVLAGTCPVVGQVDTDGPEPAITVASGFRLKITERVTDPGEAIAAMDAAGLDVVTPSIPPPIRQYEADLGVARQVCRTMNDAFAELARSHGGRFRPLANVPLAHPQAAADELRRCSGELGLAGVAIGTNVEGRNLGDADFRPFWRAVAELDTFVFLHPETPMGADRLCRHELENFVGFPIDTAAAAASMMFDGVYEEFGPLKTCYAHGGGAFPYLLSRWEHGYWARIAQRGTGVGSPRSYLHSMYCDSLTHGDRQLEFLLDVVGADHVMLGSDYPFDMGDPQPVKTMEAVVADPAARGLVGGGTAARLLGIEAG